MSIFPSNFLSYLNSLLQIQVYLFFFWFSSETKPCCHSIILNVIRLSFWLIEFKGFLKYNKNMILNIFLQLIFQKIDHCQLEHEIKIHKHYVDTLNRLFLILNLLYWLLVNDLKNLDSCNEFHLLHPLCLSKMNHFFINFLLTIYSSINYSIKVAAGIPLSPSSY
jgi:hypothetical protein